MAMVMAQEEAQHQKSRAGNRAHRTAGQKQQGLRLETRLSLFLSLTNVRLLRAYYLNLATLSNTISY